ncbi:unnamed protein product [Microthlaspi erraticum]|uniref:Uncharacterized protein n=1 Tax=Microthlaspi erraticum TaxID=1685480 RepID=A0A6D2HKN4_9BRAS|nr:unnamed protein product [Microthlaspi erraticum]
MSRKDVIVCRGIWYVMTLLSIFGLSISLNLLWPPGEKSSLVSWSRFLRDGAVSVATIYAVTLFRYFCFSDPPSPCYKVFTTKTERIIQGLFSLLLLSAVIISSPLQYKLLMEKAFVLPVSLFSISSFTGGIGLMQLSDKLRMEVRHALRTLFLGWLFCLCGIYICCSYDPAVDTEGLVYLLRVEFQLLVASSFCSYSARLEEDKPRGCLQILERYRHACALISCLLFFFFWF